MRRPEQELQIAIVKAVKRLVGMPPEESGLTQEDRDALGLLYHTPNGLFTLPHLAYHAKLMGLRAGVPDLHLPVARGRHHGLWIEVKAAGGRVSTAQTAFISQLLAEGHAVLVTKSRDQAVKTILAYLAGRLSDATPEEVG